MITRADYEDLKKDCFRASNPKVDDFIKEHLKDIIGYLEYNIRQGRFFTLTKYFSYEKMPIQTHEFYSAFKTEIMTKVASEFKLHGWDCEVTCQNESEGDGFSFYFKIS